ncbi:DUF5336 domain-containing protein [Catenulispora rubra]|uniref:DUF5336 domain-containing protein n=1 Tax=Catenulispora rubra TaxID=280293 RepID=UPI0018921802|nr:DUF5336 domain-containing protein [Catenulispora rubra]
MSMPSGASGGGGESVPEPQSPPHQPAQSPPLHAPGQPPHQPPPHVPGQPPYQPPRAAVTVPLGKMLYLCVAALGVINLFLGYVSAGDGDSMNLYKVGVAIYALAPTMFFLAGLVAVREFLPRERAPGALPAMITTAIFVTLVLSAISSDGAGDLQTLFLVFGAVQFVLAWLAYVFDVRIIGARR